MPDLDVTGYLDRLGVAAPGAPSVAGLLALHRAHVERIPYETLEIALGRPTTIDPYESADRIVRLRRAGYCYHLNGAFSALLGALGYRVTRHRGAVHGPAGLGDEEPGNHLALLVHDLPDERAPEGTWYVDAGLGDALRDAVPLRPATLHQEPFTLVLERSTALAGWHLQHDPRGSFTGVHIEAATTTPRALEPRHQVLSTSAQSGFVRLLTVQRRDATGVDALRGCVLTRLDATGATSRDVLDRADWLAVLTDGFGIGLDDVPAGERAALWRRVRDAHDAWDAAGRA